MKHLLPVVLLLAFAGPLFSQVPEPVTAPGPPPDQLLGGLSVVIDPAHIAKTVAQMAIDIAIQRLHEKGVDLQERDIERLFGNIFVDSQNFTGAFLANMLFEHGAPESPLPTISIFHSDVEDIFRDLFPPFVPYGEINTDFVPFPIEDAVDWRRLIHLLRREEAARLMRIWREHAAQLSRERQGLWSQRFNFNAADGNVQHLQHIAAVLHQMADAQSVERQLMLLERNRLLVRDLAQDTREAQATATLLEILHAWSPPGSTSPRTRSGHRVSDWF